ncbi:Uncharacterised protein [Corynebacterium kutscheri]|uniref:Uncharacterized protein n=1 Tax=Corynebacterium kutscheri TaxID=35755 RepID=A0A0F6R1K4_9CORY|nr:hypothetical protein [Corynebacterium kutscheri]AKE41098.1 hypothetical protein UL82_04560 [Corynebacterium kutscheri]VEH07003.1 Uncharacterised protein [Corynebacterium kutscheri]VEH09414.1 Uncharacterised protein [Corynebacterium kutscheri]VEH79498.1 Uncharacterised protein [Corynebacterium kutscheri]
MPVNDSANSDLCLPPGYRRGALGQWLTLPWPEDQETKLELLENSLGPLLID